MKYLLPTEEGLLAIWNPGEFNNINSRQTYVHDFVERMVEIANQGKAAIWSTAGDGKFSVDVRVDPDSDLSAEEKSVVEFEALNLKLSVKEKLILGSPEFVGSAEMDGLETRTIHKLELQNGLYSVNVYFLYDEDSDELPDFVVALHGVDENHQFELLREIPVLG